MVQPPGQSRDTWLAAVVSNWAVQDSSSAAHYVASLADAAAQQAAAIVLAPTLAQTEPRRALGWTLGLAGDARRDATVVAFQTWLGNDPVAARAWQAGAGLPADIAAALKNLP